MEHELDRLLTFLAERITAGLSLGNLVLASANVIIGFSLLAYILTHNFRSLVARAFSALLAFVTLVYVGDILVANVISPPLTVLWLRFQWLGIAFVPAACLHFSSALLQTTRPASSRLRVAVTVSYVISLVMFVLAAVTDLIVFDGESTQWINRLTPGPYFGAFTAYFFVTVTVAVLNVFRARQRCLTATSRRRMTYLTVAIIAPGYGVFPYLLVATMVTAVPPNVVLLLSLLGNLAVGLMTVVSAYTVAYQGAFAPDRVVKHNLIHYLLRGPLVGSAVVALMEIVPRVEAILGLPRYTVLVFAVTVGIVLMQLAIEFAKPYIDRIVNRQDQEEVSWIQQLDRRLLTSTDLEQLLENVLTSLCDYLRVSSGFIVSLRGDNLEISVVSGPRAAAERVLRECDWHELVSAFQEDGPARSLLREDDFKARDGYWLLALRSKDGESTLGVLGIEAKGQVNALSAAELATVGEFIGQAELGLEDMHLQQQVFIALHQIVPEIDRIRRWREPSLAASQRLRSLESNPVFAPGFVKVVQDALRDYWGGPRLANSPLVQTRVVSQALKTSDGVPASAVRAVLTEAVDRLKPPGQRSMTSSEWTVYNILEMRFLQGRRIREVCERLAMSESDFYRKQRVAIDQVTETVAAMEVEATARE